MAKKLSFTKFEHEILPEFRDKINKAESTEDVKKFFVRTAAEILENVFGERLPVAQEDVDFTPEKAPHFRLSKRLRSASQFATVWRDSDLERVLARLARSAVNRYTHLEKHPEKTDAKIRM